MGFINNLLREKIKKVAEPAVIDATEVAKEQIKKHVDTALVPVLVTVISVALTYYSVIKPPKSCKEAAKVINNYYYNYYIIKKSSR